MIATIAEKKVQRSLRSYGNHSSAIVAIVAIVATTIEIDVSSISTIVAIVAIIWKPLSRDCCDRVAMKNIPECSTSLFVPGPLGQFFYSVTIVAIIWKLVVVRIAQLFCSDRRDHMETIAITKIKDYSQSTTESLYDHWDRTEVYLSDRCRNDHCDRFDRWKSGFLIWS